MRQPIAIAITLSILLLGAAGDAATKTRARSGYQHGQFTIRTKLGHDKLSDADWNRRAKSVERFLDRFQRGLGGMVDGKLAKSEYFQIVEIKKNSKGFAIEWDKYGGTNKRPQSLVSNKDATPHEMMADWNSGRALAAGAVDLSPKQAAIVRLSEKPIGISLRLFKSVREARKWKARWQKLNPVGGKKIVARKALASTTSELATMLPKLTEDVMTVVEKIGSIRKKLSNRSTESEGVAKAREFLAEYGKDAKISSDPKQINDYLKAIEKFAADPRNHSAAMNAMVVAMAKGDTTIKNNRIISIGSPIVVDRVSVDTGHAPTTSTGGQKMEKYIPMREGNVTIENNGLLGVGDPITYDEVLVNAGMLNRVTKAIVQAGIDNAAKK